ncbi:MoaF N-terminal domain-containing protein [Tenacibaculum ovolyticum]|uniref:MoaF-related domain-containing protein n=1 Tax=Tenacibaculum ovolyticum TaxID=104270 RepID=UPI0022F3F1D4|nr:MoaF C-terminal domain-containing protein [Tenacibaculum ovolyticum]WBX78318.1 MoaF N-terminal domain-containing protein [Tenacibaculum ovolyticum]
MKNAIFAIMILIINISCENAEITQEEKSISEKIISLSGKTLEYNYGNYVYELNFKSENKLHWKCVKGDEKGEEADETYSTQRLNNYTLFVSWIEQGGLGVSQVINLKENTINSFLKIDKEIIPLSGTIREL